MIRSVYLSFALIILAAYSAEAQFWFLGQKAKERYEGIPFKPHSSVSFGAGSSPSPTVLAPWPTYDRFLCYLRLATWFSCLSGIGAVRARSASGEGRPALHAPVQTNDSVCPAGCEKLAAARAGPGATMRAHVDIAAWPPALPDDAICLCAPDCCARCIEC